MTSQRDKSKLLKLKTDGVRNIIGNNNNNVVKDILNGTSLLSIKIYKKRKKKKFIKTNNIPKNDQTNIILSLELLVHVIKSNINHRENKISGVAKALLNKEFLSFINTYKLTTIEINIIGI